MRVWRERPFVQREWGDAPSWGWREEGHTQTSWGGRTAQAGGGAVAAVVAMGHRRRRGRGVSTGNMVVLGESCQLRVMRERYRCAHWQEEGQGERCLSLVWQKSDPCRLKHVVVGRGSTVPQSFPFPRGRERKNPQGMKRQMFPKQETAGHRSGLWGKGTVWEMRTENQDGTFEPGIMGGGLLDWESRAMVLP